MWEVVEVEENMQKLEDPWGWAGEGATEDTFEGRSPGLPGSPAESLPGALEVQRGAQGLVLP